MRRPEWQEGSRVGSPAWARASTTIEATAGAELLGVYLLLKVFANALLLKQVQTHTYTHTHIHIFMYLYIYIHCYFQYIYVTI